MSDRFIPLDCDDDVVLLEKDTFKVSRLKELAIQEIRNKLNHQIYDTSTKQPGNKLFYFFGSLPLPVENINYDEIQLVFIKNCQLLQTNGKGWQEGKLKIQLYSLSRLSNHDIKANLDFCPDEPLASESPLDDIRKMVQTEN